MQTVKRIIVDLQRKVLPLVHAMQNDTGTRAVKVALYDDCVAWTPPAGVTVSVAYRKPDGTAGKYDTLPDGSAACSVTGNEVVAVLAPAVLTTPGRIKASVVFETGDNRLTTFPFEIMAEVDPAAGPADSGQTAYDEGYAAAQKADYDRFWDMFQQNGNRADYQYAFSRAWTDEFYNPKYPIVCNNANVYTATALFMDSQITDTKVPITASGTRADTMFQDCRNLNRIPMVTFDNVTRFNNTFRNCQALTDITIDGSIDVAISFAESPLLNRASIESIINALSTTTSGLTLTLSSAAVTAAFGSTTAADWTALVGTRNNWTISLV